MSVVAASGAAANNTQASIRRAASDPITKEHKRCRRALEKVADEWLCQITQELRVDPVMAEDSRFYERASIEE
jgi:hypothetical protein